MDEREPIVQNMTFDWSLKKAFNQVMRSGGREMARRVIHNIKTH